MGFLHGMRPRRGPHPSWPGDNSLQDNPSSVDGPPVGGSGPLNPKVVLYYGKPETLGGLFVPGRTWPGRTPQWYIYCWNAGGKPRRRIAHAWTLTWPD